MISDFVTNSYGESWNSSAGCKETQFYSLQFMYVPVHKSFQLI